MILKFKPEDFHHAGVSYSLCGYYTKEEIFRYQQFLADDANARLEEMIRGAPIVYRIDKLDGTWFPAEGYRTDAATHRARLVEIEELKK